MGWTTEVRFSAGEGIFLFTTASNPALGPIQPSIQWEPGIKRPEREADHSPPPIADVKNAWRETSTLPYVFMSWYFVMPRDSFTFTFTDNAQFNPCYHNQFQSF
jgi:hypothetical protein